MAARAHSGAFARGQGSMRSLSIAHDTPPSRSARSKREPCDARLRNTVGGRVEDAWRDSHARRTIASPVREYYGQPVRRAYKRSATVEAADDPTHWLSSYPDLLNQLAPTKNKGLRPANIPRRSHQRLWWRCRVAPDHEWLASVATRVAGTGCPFCAHKRASVTNSLAAIHPQVAESWHRRRNGNLRPEHVLSGSKRSVWWQCSVAPDHEWKTPVTRRTYLGTGCPFCSNREVAKSNSLAAISPAVAREWHPTRNGRKTAWDFTCGSSRRVWWRCSKDETHEWQASIRQRARTHTGCPCCVGTRVTAATSLAARYPDVARNWHPTRNGHLSADAVSPFSRRIVWWQCDRGHSWQRSVAQQSRGNCPYCSGHRLASDNSLRAVFPTLATQWHDGLNGRATPDSVTSRSRMRVWWRCSTDPLHLWQATIHGRTNTVPPTDCPHCWAIRRRRG
jgi:hypothetical protein